MTRFHQFARARHCYSYARPAATLPLCLGVSAIENKPLRAGVPEFVALMWRASTDTLGIAGGTKALLKKTK